MKEVESQLPIVATKVSELGRMFFLPRHFGPRLMLRGEVTIYQWMKRLCRDYGGGSWTFYDLSGGGFYMAPDMGRMRIEVVSNYFSGEMSADAAGIVATLFALCQLAEEYVEEEEGDAFARNFHCLRDYAVTHPEAPTIIRAID